MADWEIILIRGSRYAVEQCGSCGVYYVVPEIVHKQHFADGGYAHCSNGHQWGWREGHVERDAIRRERDRLKQDAARLEEEARIAWATANEQTKQRQAAEQKLRAQSQRLGAGVCPCCNRTFSQLARHMQTKHPDVPYVPAKKAVAKA